MSSRPLLSALVLLALPAAALAGRVEASDVTASSSYPPEDGVSYEAKRAVDGKVSTAWVEGEEGSGLGSWLEIDLGGTRTVEKLKIWGGLWYSSEYWSRANRPHEIEVRYDDDSVDTFALADEMKPFTFALPNQKTTSKVRVRVKSVHSGTTWLDTAISEVQVFDAAASDAAPVREITASSVADADADGSYPPANVADGITDTMWCEGGGDGTGEWLDVAFGGAQQVGAVRIVNGIGTSLPFWMKGNRATAATIAFPDGTTREIAIKNTLMPQTVEFAPHTASSARITFTEIAKGKEFDDLCISEAVFLTR